MVQPNRYKVLALAVLAILASLGSALTINGEIFDMFSEATGQIGLDQALSTNLGMMQKEFETFLISKHHKVGENLTSRKVSYVLHNKSGQTILDNGTLNKLTIEPTVFIIHGWMDSSQAPWYAKMIEAYKKKGSYNIIAVNWSEPGETPYPIAAALTKDVGEAIGDLIISINQISKIPYDQIHVIGHSLGAHVAGSAGNRIFQKTRQKIQRISALDPARPLFEFPPSLRILKKDDADFVDVVHTDGGVLGCLKPLGHVDFYVNGGTAIQKGCTEMTKFNIKEAFCSHMKSIDYFIEGVLENHLVGTQCDNKVKFELSMCDGNARNVMGEETNENIHGVFFLETNSEPPYGMS